MVVKRGLGFLIDMIIISFIGSILMFALDINTDKFITETNNLLDNHLQQEVTSEVFADEMSELVYKQDKEQASYNLLAVVSYFILFVTVPLKLKATPGMKIMKTEFEDITLIKLIVRMFVITGIYVNIIGLILISFTSANIYVYITIPLAFLSLVVSFVTMFMILYRKDNKGIQDLITKSSIVLRKEENHEKI